MIPDEAVCIFRRENDPSLDRTKTGCSLAVMNPLARYCVEMVSIGNLNSDR